METECSGVNVTLVIPPDGKEGDTLTFHVEGQTLEIEVPMGSKPGDTLEITIGGNNNTPEPPPEKEDDTTTTVVDLGRDKKVTLCASSRDAQWSQDGDGTNYEAWSAGILLARFLTADDSVRTAVTGKRVIELGSGLGLCGIAAAMAGAKSVIVTDRECALPVLRGNIERNGMTSSISAESLVWGETRGDEELDVILGADLLYDPNAGYDDLVKTIVSILGGPRILLAVRWRWHEREKKFFEMMEERGYKFVLANNCDDLPCKIHWREYGNPDCEGAVDYFSGSMVGVGRDGLILPLGDITEEHQGMMKDDQYDLFERLQTQIYVGSRDK